MPKTVPPPSTLIVRIITGVAAVAVVIAAILALGGGRSYTLKLAMSDASGLRPGSLVNVGGVQVGTVKSIDLGRGDDVVATLRLDPGKVHPGRGASSVITAANLLGEEFVALNPGNASQPLPSGSVLPASRTTPPTDLDQITGVLDRSTRSRLAILLNEAGIALAGRRSDVSATLRQLPISATTATTLLGQLVHDNTTLAQLITSSNEFIARINQQAPDLKRTLSSAAGAATTLGLRANQLRATITQAPATLVTLQAFLSKAGDTASRLTPAAGQLADSASPLRQLLATVTPFARAAVPTLKQAAGIAPELSTLATQATPTVAASLPMLTSLHHIASLAQPLSAWLGLSGTDLVQVLAGWSHAIAERDGVSHIFGGDVFMNPLVILDAANHGATAAQRRQNLLDVLNPALLKTMGLLGAAKKARQEAAASRHAGTLSGAANRPTESRAPAEPATPPSAGTGTGSTTSASSSSTTAQPQSPTAGLAQPLSKLLNFLLKP